MNNIHEKDWAEDYWGGFSGMDNLSGWCTTNKEVNDIPVANTDDNECPRKKSPESAMMGLKV